jgi:hypothetical protein
MDKWQYAAAIVNATAATTGRLSLPSSPLPGQPLPAHLLVAALHGAVSLKEVHGTALAVGKDLHLQAGTRRSVDGSDEAGYQIPLRLLPGPDSGHHSLPTLPTHGVPQCVGGG